MLLAALLLFNLQIGAFFVNSEDVHEGGYSPFCRNHLIPQTQRYPSILHRRFNSTRITSSQEILPGSQELSSSTSEENESMYTSYCSIRNQYFYTDSAEFLHHAVAECYYYVLPVEKRQLFCLDSPKLCFRENFMTKNLVNDQMCFQANNKLSFDDTKLSAFIDDKTKLKATLCIRNALECCSRMYNAVLSRNKRRSGSSWDEGTGCPGTWDGLTCFDDTKENKVVYAVCPAYIYEGIAPPCGFQSRRVCLKGGQWETHSVKGHATEFTDYEGCFATDIDAHANVYHFTIILLALSVLFCLPAVFIFSCYKALQSQRISLHKNLVIAVLLSSFCQLLDHLLVTLKAIEGKAEDDEDDEGPIPHVWWCKALQVSVKYFWTAQYSWMLNEGFYLHTLISQAFVEYSTLTKYYIFGWGFPLVVNAVYFGLVGVYADYSCWRDINVYDSIFVASSSLCLMLNIVFMARVIYVIITKLKGPDNQESTNINNFRRVFRAILILMPLFGLHYILSLMVSATGCHNNIVYKYLTWGIMGSQGIFVSLVLCYGNGEVRYHLKRSYLKFLDSRRLSQDKSGRVSDAARLSMVTLQSEISSNRHNSHTPRRSLV